MNRCPAVVSGTTASNTSPAPGNPFLGKLSLVAFGVFSEVATGYPLLLCEMTLLTALRTAAVAALGASYLARRDASHPALIGTGAQAEFLAMPLRLVRPIEQISSFNVDAAAVHKFTSG